MMPSSKVKGFTLVELMIAMALASIVSAFLLMLTRSQLIAYEMNDQLTKAQQNARAGLGFVENLLRRACGGISNGGVGINVPALTPAATSCVRTWDGATLAAGSFAVGTPASLPDAVELVYGTAPMTVATTVTNAASSSVSVTVPDSTGFNDEDFVMLTDFQQAAVFKVQSHTATSLTFYSTSSAAVYPNNGTAYLPTTGNSVLKAASVSIYVAAAGAYQGMLMIDPDGMFGNSHDDAEPLVENVEDFQVAVGSDSNADGLLTDATPDEWVGNASGETLPALPWNQAAGVGAQLRAIRATLMVRTSSKYSGDAPALAAIEDRTAYPTPGQGTFRYRTMQMRVAPRVWNLGN
jgi:type IV pilus assembly protein PilW